MPISRRCSRLERPKVMLFVGVVGVTEIVEHRDCFEKAAQRRPLLVIDARVGGLERHEVDNSRLRGPQATFLYADARAHRQGFPRAGATLGQMKKAARRRHC